MLEPNQGRPSPCGSVRNPLRELHQLGTYKIGLVVFAELRGLSRASPYDAHTIYATGVAGARVSVESPATAKRNKRQLRRPRSIRVQESRRLQWAWTTLFTIQTDGGGGYYG